MEVRELGVDDDMYEFWKSAVGFENMHFNQWSGMYSWYEMLSPSGRLIAESPEGSLYIREVSSGSWSKLLENTGNFNPDWGVDGFHSPVWTADERYVLGMIDSNIVVVEVDTARSGILTSGSHPLARIPGYHPGDPGGGFMYESFIRTGGH